MNADGGPAFPVPDLHPGAVQVGSSGMSLRDWFAGQALVAGGTGRMPGAIEVVNPHDVAKKCYTYADAMLRAREGGAR